MSLDVAFSMFSFLRTASKVKQSANRSVVSDSLQPRGLYSPWDSPDQNTGVGSLSLLQEIFPTQGANTGLPHCRLIVYHLSHQGSPRILEWVVYSFSRGSSQPRNWTGVSCIAGGLLTSWAVRIWGMILKISSSTKASWYMGSGFWQIF